jgi:hypothetical protein
MERRVEPELLDHLPPRDERAIRSRRDLQRINAWMRNPGILAACLRSAFPTSRPRNLLELGAGDGTFLLKVARKLCQFWPPSTLTLVDRQPVIQPEIIRGFEAIGWSVQVIVIDVFEFLEQPSAIFFDAIVANLFLHHFSHAQLTKLFDAAARRTRVFAAVEPRRARGSLIAGHLLWAIGCNDVTRHDALVSIRAGFADRELSRLWPQQPNWKLEEHAANLSSHLFVAQQVRVDSEAEKKP